VITAQVDIELADWRRRIGDLYRVRGQDPLKAWREGRDRLFATHPQSPIADSNRPGFKGLHYFDPDPRYRIRCRLEQARPGVPGLTSTPAAKME